MGGKCFGAELANTPIHQSYFTGKAVDKGIATQGSFTGAIVYDGHLAGNRRGCDGRAPTGRGRGRIAANDVNRCIDFQDVAALSVPHIHLHAATAAIRRGREVGVVASAAVETLCAYKVALLAHFSVVIGLKVPGGLIESKAVGDVVHHVVHIEQIGDGGIDIALRLCVRVEHIVKDKVRPAIRVRCGRGGIGIVSILVCVHIIAAGDGKLRAWLAISIVPSERRSHRIVRIRHHGLYPVGRTLHGEGKDAVSAVGSGSNRTGCSGLCCCFSVRLCARRTGSMGMPRLAIHRAVVFVNNLTGHRVHADAPHVRGVCLINHQMPG